MFNNGQNTTHHTLPMLLVMTIFGMLYSTTGYAKTLKAAIIKSEPYGILTKEGQVRGLHYQILKRVAEEAGFELIAEIDPFARVLKKIETGNADLTCMFKNENINKNAIIISSTSSSNRVVVFGHAGTSFTNLSDLHGKVVANIRGANYSEEFNNDPQIRKYLVSGYRQGLEMFLRKRVDAMVGPEIGILYTAKVMGLSYDIFGKPLVLSIQEGYIFLSKKRRTDDIVAKLKDAADRLRKEGIFEDIEKSYLIH